MVFLRVQEDSQEKKKEAKKRTDKKELMCKLSVNLTSSCSLIPKTVIKQTSGGYF